LPLLKFQPRMKVQKVGRDYLRFEDQLDSSGSSRGRRQHS